MQRQYATWEQRGGTPEQALGEPGYAARALVREAAPEHRVTGVFLPGALAMCSVSGHFLAAGALPPLAQWHPANLLMWASALTALFIVLVRGQSWPVARSRLWWGLVLGWVVGLLWGSLSTHGDHSVSLASCVLVSAALAAWAVVVWQLSRAWVQRRWGGNPIGRSVLVLVSMTPVAIQVLTEWDILIRG